MLVEESSSPTSGSVPNALNIAIFSMPVASAMSNRSCTFDFSSEVSACGTRITFKPGRTFCAVSFVSPLNFMLVSFVA